MHESFFGKPQDSFSQYLLEGPHQSLTYLDIYNKVVELSDLVELPKRTLVAVQEHGPLEVLIQVLTLWTKDCVPVLIPADTPVDLMDEYEKQVPFGESCPEGNLVFLLQALKELQKELFIAMKLCSIRRSPPTTFTICKPRNVGV